MTGVRPELLYVAGPQAGEHAVLMDNVCLAGRSPRAAVRIEEETVSREHVQFSLTRHGWVVENLSKTNPLVINGRPFKPGKQIALSTGDVIELGAETTLLFVEAGDDAREALAAYRAETSPPQPLPAQPAHPEPAEPSIADVEPEPPAEEASEPDESEERSEDELRRRKYRKYLVALVVYLVAMAGVFAFLMSIRRGPEQRDTRDDRPAVLSSETIADALSEPLERTPNEFAARKHLRAARDFFARKNLESSNLYLAVKNYRLYLAYRPRDQRVFEPQDERNRETAERELIETVQELYDQAIIAENRQQWGMAHAILERLTRDILPIEQTTDDPPVNDRLIDNFRAHWRYVSRQLNRK